MIFADCTSNRHGLGNRLTIICGAYASAKVAGQELKIAWAPGLDCVARWDDLYEPLPDIEMLSRKPTSGHRHRACTYQANKRAAHLRAAGPGRYTPAYWDAWQSCARQIRLIPELAIPDVSPFQAIHVRSLNPGRPIPLEWMNAITLPPGSFLAADGRTVFDQARKHWPDVWWLDENSATSDRGAGRRLPGVQSAARDMMMLARSRSIIAIGGPSTFRNVPHIGFGVPVLKFYQGANP